MFSKIFILFVSIFHHDNPKPVKVHPVVVVPEDEIIIENVKPQMVSMYY